MIHSARKMINKGSFQNSKPLRYGKPSQVSRILPGFYQLRGWEMVFVRGVGGGVKRHKITSHFLKVPSYFGPLRVKTMSHIGGVGPSSYERFLGKCKIRPPSICAILDLKTLQLKKVKKYPESHNS